MFPRSAVAILVFLLVTVATIGVVASVRLKRAEECSRRVRAASDITSLSTFLDTYRGMNGTFPTTEQGLGALVERPTSSPVPLAWHQFTELVLTDPWNMPYIYRFPGTKHPNGYDLFSAGPDRVPDTADDVWREQQSQSLSQ